MINNIIEIKKTLKGIGFNEVPSSLQHLYFTRDSDGQQLTIDKETGYMKSLDKFGKKISEYKNYEEFLEYI